MVAASDVFPWNGQVLVTHASGLALTALIAASSDPRGPEVYVDNAAGKGGMVLTVNLTTFLLVTGYVSISYRTPVNPFSRPGWLSPPHLRLSEG